ncbi:mandelate racemase/muconate lactonizing enzyme family protein [Sporomusa sp. KB1]|jgi:mandelate racemase|uniref:mandelate racemase/muconate lactonizing enzyme family protein n=1 Tax=Sporomusa sp. KB1 TaxID=943346 RepID=UPI0011A5B085|nr:mandelate racemase/muconate lactonizing enzyme family protein [Sporomusa sp. KB1]TWH51773.1 mandelate racemase [Sporomusa sp. KB1]
MKITQVEVFHVHLRKNSGQRPILVRIDTDEGIFGVGEAGMAYGVGGSGAAGMIKDLSRLILGLDPFNTEFIWEKFFKKTFWGQGGGTVVFSGMSALDMALWDIKGKALGLPLYKLLGGKCRNDLRVYASQIQFGWGLERKPKGLKEEYAEEALKAVAQGYDAIKVDVLALNRKGTNENVHLEGPLPNSVIQIGVERVKAIREAVGPNVDIIIENHANTDMVSAIQFAKAIEEYNIFFYEEINTPLNPKLLQKAKEKINIPIASGERIYTRWGYLPFFADRSIDIIQPDIGSCGGFSEFKKIADIAHAYEVTVQAHVAGTGVAEAAALHAETAIPNFCIHEHHQKTLLPEYVELCVHNYQPVNGRYTVPELPGIGQDFTEKVFTDSDRILIK